VGDPVSCLVITVPLTCISPATIALLFTDDELKADESEAEELVIANDDGTDEDAGTLEGEVDDLPLPPPHAVNNPARLNKNT
jgi:hypothetical protein